MDGGERKREKTKRVKRARARAALAGTGAAFSGLSTFFNARRQLSRSSPSFDPFATSSVVYPALFFVSSGSFARLLHFRRIRLLLPPFRRQTILSTTYTLLSRRTTTSVARVFAHADALEDRESESLSGCCCLAATDKRH